MKKPLHTHIKKTTAPAIRMLAFDPNGLLKLRLGALKPPLPPPLPPLPPPRCEGGGISVLLGLLDGLLAAPGDFLPPKMPAILSLKSLQSSSRSGGPSDLFGWLVGRLFGWASTGWLVSGSAFGAWSLPCPSLASLDPPELWLLPQPGSLTENSPRNLRVIRKIARVGNRIKFRSFWSFR